MEYSLGIDLGTTYSAAATARDGRLEIFQLGERAATIPSIVLLRADGEVLTGEAAERRALAEPTRTGREFKRRLGDPTPIILGGTPYGAEALLAHLLRAIVLRVTEQLGGPPAAVALCHPASYGAYKIDLLRQAVRQADVGTVSLLTEPEAAALDYARQERVPAGTAIAVYDFGGGTFDATVLRKTEAGFEQLGQPEGMERLGGIDFDEALFIRAMDVVRATGAELDANDPATLAAIARLREECRRDKEALSSDTDATIQISLPGLHTEMRLTRAEFEEMIRPRIRETIDALGRAVRSAGLGFDDVDRVLLVGGTSRIPLVAEMVRESTGRPVAVDAHPKHTMALGAAYVAEQSRLAAAVAGAEAPAPVVAVAPPVAAVAAEPPAVEPPAAEPPAAAPPVAPAPPPAAAPAPAAAPPAAAPLPAAAAPSPEPQATEQPPPRAPVRADPPPPAQPPARIPGAPVPPRAVPQTGRAVPPAAPAAPLSATSGGAAGPGLLMRVDGTMPPPPGQPSAASSGGSDRRRMLIGGAVTAAIVLALAVAVGASGLLSGGSSPAPSGSGLAVASVSASPSASASPSPTPSASPTPTPTPSPSPSPTPTPPPPRHAQIVGITTSNGRYVVDYEVAGYDPVLPGRHLHFFFDTVPPTEAGVPGSGPWIIYAGPVPFTGWRVSDRPAGATQMCILVANSNHSVVQGTGNCVDLPG